MSKSEPDFFLYLDRLR